VIRMRKPLSFVLGAGLLALTTAGLCSAQEQDQPALTPHSYRSEHFSIQIPKGWEELDRPALDQLEAGPEGSPPEFRAQTFQHGFKETAAAAYPMILIQIEGRKRWTRNFLASLDALPPPSNAAGSASNNFTNLRRTRFYRDQRRKMVWIRLESKRPDGTPVSDISAVYPTRSGSVQIHCTTTLASVDNYASLCESVLTSVQVDPSVRYWPF